MRRNDLVSAVGIGAILFIVVKFMNYNNVLRNKRSIEKFERNLETEEFFVIEEATSDVYPILHAPHLVGRKIPIEKVQCRGKSNFRIPNVIHYVWFGKWEIKRLHYLSIRSAAMVQRPNKIVLHLDEAPPIGEYWRRIKREIPCLEIVKAVRPDYIFGRQIRDIEHKSDMERMRILREDGGIYADVNLMFIQPLDRLLNKSFVIGKEDDRTYGNSLLLSEPHSPFMELWHQTYFTFDYTQWGEHSTEMPKRIHEEYPELPIHVEQYSVMRPNYDDDFAWMSNDNWDLRHSYSIHIYVHEREASQWLPDVMELPFSRLITFDNTFGQLVRLALFGTPYLTLEEVDKSMYESHTPMKCSQSITNKDQTMIPKTIHYLYDGGKMDLQNYLSIRSAVHSIVPDEVIIHLLKIEDPLHYRYLQLWWEIPCLKLQNSTDIYSKIKLFKKNPNLRDLTARLFILEKFGGISLSNDSIISGNFEKFRKWDVVSEKRHDSQIIMSKKNSPFIKNWLEMITTEQFKEHEDNEWLLPPSTVRTEENVKLVDDYENANDHTPRHLKSLLWFDWPSHMNEKNLLLSGNDTFAQIARETLLK